MVTGLRRGELSALRWAHVDFDRGTLLVQRANAQPRSGIREKKTKAGQHRRIAMDQRTVALVTAHRDGVVARCAALGCELDLDSWVFSPARDGSSPHPPRSLTQKYRRLAIKLGLRSTRLRSLWHYSATELIAAGVDVRTVAGRLGHGSGGATTLKIYAAWVDEAGRRAADTMAGIMPQQIVAMAAPPSPYEVVAAELRRQIERGELKPGDNLPTVAELSRLHAVSVGTTHRAVALLKNEGLIDVARGRRAVVVGRARPYTD
jgi:hypothetical protein